MRPSVPSARYECGTSRISAALGEATPSQAKTQGLGRLGATRIGPAAVCDDCSMSLQAQVLLEHLAATSWFAQHGEVALTGGLAFCLEKDPGAAEAFIELIRTRGEHTAPDLPLPVRWQAEYGDSRMRSDVAGLGGTDEDSPPILCVEAKVSADFAPRQVSEYVAFQRRQLASAHVASGALVVLVPKARVLAAQHEIGADLADLPIASYDEGWLVGADPAVSVTVVSWDEAIQAMQAANGAAAADLDQLLGACRGLQGADVTAFTEADLAGEWLQRTDDVRNVIERVTREAIAKLSLGSLPWQVKPVDGLEGGFRYLGVSNRPNLAVGMRTGETQRPLWVRWHRTTPEIESVERRLKHLGYGVEKQDEHLWVALELEPDFGSATRQINDLLEQVVTLYNISVGWTASC